MTPEGGLADLSRCGRQRAARARRRSWPGIASQLDLPPDLPMLAIDMVLFEQVLFNLLDNAAKYAPAGTAITAAGAAATTAGSGCRCWTKGRASRPTISSASSTSSTVRRRPTAAAPAPGSASRSAAASCEAMGGTITAANRTDRPGAVFTIDLPEPRRPGSAGRAAMTNGLRILIVDDEPAIRRFLRASLRAQGYLPAEAETGQAALDAIGRGRGGSGGARSRAARHGRDRR